MRDPWTSPAEFFLANLTTSGGTAQVGITRWLLDRGVGHLSLYVNRTISQSSGTRSTDSAFGPFTTWFEVKICQRTVCLPQRYARATQCARCHVTSPPSHHPKFMSTHHQAASLVAMVSQHVTDSHDASHHVSRITV